MTWIRNWWPLGLGSGTGGRCGLGLGTGGRWGLDQELVVVVGLDQELVAAVGLDQELVAAVGLDQELVVVVRLAFELVGFGGLTLHAAMEKMVRTRVPETFLEQGQIPLDSNPLMATFIVSTITQASPNSFAIW